MPRTRAASAPRTTSRSVAPRRAVSAPARAALPGAPLLPPRPAAARGEPGSATAAPRVPAQPPRRRARRGGVRAAQIPRASQPSPRPGRQRPQRDATRRRRRRPGAASACRGRGCAPACALAAVRVCQRRGRRRTRTSGCLNRTRPSTTATVIGELGRLERRDRRTPGARSTVDQLHRRIVLPQRRAARPAASPPPTRGCDPRRPARPSARRTASASTSAAASSSNASGFPAAERRTTSAAAAPTSLPKRRRSSRRASAVSSGRSIKLGTPGSATVAPAPLRAATTTESRSDASRRTTNATASNDSESSHCASSTIDQQRTSPLGFIREQRQRREPDQHSIRGRRGRQPERRRQRLGLSRRQSIEVVEKRPQQLVEPGVGELGLGLVASGAQDERIRPHRLLGQLEQHCLADPRFRRAPAARRRRLPGRSRAGAGRRPPLDLAPRASRSLSR